MLMALLKVRKSKAESSLCLLASSCWQCRGSADVSSSLVGAALGGPEDGQLISNCVHGVLQQQITLLSNLLQTQPMQGLWHLRGGRNMERPQT